MAGGPQRYLIDYWKIWEGATDNAAPTDIILDGRVAVVSPDESKSDVDVYDTYLTLRDPDLRACGANVAPPRCGSYPALPRGPGPLGRGVGRGQRGRVARTGGVEA